MRANLVFWFVQSKWNIIKRNVWETNILMGKSKLKYNKCAFRLHKMDSMEAFIMDAVKKM